MRDPRKPTARPHPASRPPRFYDPARGQCACPDAGLGQIKQAMQLGCIGHEYRETGERGGVYVVVCLSCEGSVVPDFDRALREAQTTLSKIGKADQ